LENHSDFFTLRSQRFTGKRIDPRISVVNFSGIRLFQQTDQPYKRRFARPAFSDNTENRMRWNFKTDAVYRLQVSIPFIYVY